MWLEIQIFGFRALWSPYFFSFIVLLGIVYFIVTTSSFRLRFGNVQTPTVRQQALFYAGLLLLYIIKGSPVELMSHIMMGAHMIQMAFLFLVVPILLIRGMPEWFLEWFVNLPVIKQIFRFFTIPLIAFAVFNSMFPIYHIPLVFDFSKSSQIAHSTITIVLFIAAVFMWWPIITPVKSQNKLNPLLKMAFLVGSIFMISIACALIIFSNDPLYEAFSADGAWIDSMSLCVPPDVLTGLSDSLSGPEMFSPLDIVDDQQFGGIIMMFLQQFIYGSVISWIFFGWFTKKSLEVDPMPTSVPYQSNNQQ